MSSMDASPRGSAWRKSSYSTNNGSCVEVAVISDTVMIADSTDLGCRVLHCSAEGWRLFVADVRAGLRGKGTMS